MTDGNREKTYGSQNKHFFSPCKIDGKNIFADSFFVHFHIPLLQIRLATDLDVQKGSHKYLNYII
jgi:hypothetical protein